MRIVAFSGLLVLAGCVTPDPQLIYTAPAGLTAQTGAMVTGSLNKTNALTSDEQVSLLSIDNQAVQGGSNAWATPVLLPAGLHVLAIEACECGFLSGNFSGSVSLAVDLKPGESYTLHASLPYSAGFFHPEETKAWVTDSTGKTVTQSTATTMERPQQPVFIPMFIPAH